MNDKTRRNEEFGRDDESMAKLLRLAGLRSPIPDDVESRVYDRVRNEWRVSSKQPQGTRVYAQVHRHWEASKPKARRWVMPVALAATVIVVIAVVVQPPPPVPARAAIGTIARVAGVGTVNMLPVVGQPIYPGESLATGAGQGMSLLLSNAESLRLDEQTTLVVNAGDEFRLVRGRVYADSGDFIYRERGLVIETSMGSVRDVGTQFSVAVDEDLVDVAVREGRVDVSQDTEQFVAVAGERLQIHRHDGATVDMLPAYDAYWDWAASLAPAFDIENKSLLDFLRWVARETGRELVFESSELRMSAMRTNLHGSVSDIDPLEALKSVLSTTRFSYRVETGRIVIEQ